MGKRVIEVGAGIGTFVRSLLNHVPVSELVLVEPSDNLFPILQRRNALLKIRLSWMTPMQR